MKEVEDHTFYYERKGLGARLRLDRDPELRDFLFCPYKRAKQSNSYQPDLPVQGAQDQLHTVLPVPSLPAIAEQDKEKEAVDKKYPTVP